MKIVATAPCRISLFGGGTDVDPFASKYGGQVLSFAVNIYHEATLTVNNFSLINLEAMDEKRQINDFGQKLVYGVDSKFDLLRAVINFFRPKLKSGFDLKIKLKAKAATGLGSSASASVAAIAALNEWLKTNLTKETIGLLAGNLEVEEIGWAGGKQDGIAAALGGINQIFFGPGKTIQVKPLKLENRLIKAFLDHTILFYIGGSRHSGQQQKNLVKGMSDKEKLKALMTLKDMVGKALELLQQGNWEALGRLIHESWLNKKMANPTASNSKIDHYYDLAIKSGAYGGKLLGSGGAGHLFFFVDPAQKTNLVKALEGEGARRIAFDLDYYGVTVKKYD